MSNHNRPVTVCIDFDNTIYDYQVKGYNKGIIDGPPLPGAKEALDNFKAQGFIIIIFSCRGDIDGMTNWLHTHEIPFDHINDGPHKFDTGNDGKPVADYYIDDRAVRFTGNWDETRNFVMDNLHDRVPFSE